jgi:hypothetical protein
MAVMKICRVLIFCVVMSCLKLHSFYCGFFKSKMTIKNLYLALSLMLITNKLLDHVKFCVQITYMHLHFFFQIFLTC